MEFWQGDMMDMDMDACEVMELSAADQMTEEDWDEFFMGCELDEVLDSIVREYGHEAHITIKAFEKAEEGATAEDLKNFIKYYEEA